MRRLEIAAVGSRSVAVVDKRIVGRFAVHVGINAYACGNGERIGLCFIGNKRITHGVDIFEKQLVIPFRKYLFGFGGHGCFDDDVIAVAVHFPDLDQDDFADVLGTCDIFKRIEF